MSIIFSYEVGMLNWYVENFFPSFCLSENEWTVFLRAITLWFCLTPNSIRHLVICSIYIKWKLRCCGINEVSFSHLVRVSSETPKYILNHLCGIFKRFSISDSFISNPFLFVNLSNAFYTVPAKSESPNRDFRSELFRWLIIIYAAISKFHFWTLFGTIYEREGIYVISAINVQLILES